MAVVQYMHQAAVRTCMHSPYMCADQHEDLDQALIEPGSEPSDVTRCQSPPNHPGDWWPHGTIDKAVRMELSAQGATDAASQQQHIRAHALPGVNQLP
jgi:hypothetical protein